MLGSLHFAIADIGGAGKKFYPQLLGLTLVCEDGILSLVRVE